ncbi:MerR family transcriptional regulator [Ochrobactrum sp. A-1]|uniref:MerR family transcriptional regulator n=1 Tax=Ochrobactrum sp. A-1 TaxID=2920940 RepID=UPI001F0A4A74|nr:helix-turn-helix domain-containing protein [Ochrobactrum sp. A-1]
MTRLISPSEVEARTGLSPDVLRDWRRRGLLQLGTQQDNGRWGYSVGDVAQLAVVNILMKWRIISDLTDAFHVAGSAVPYVYAAVADDPVYAKKVGKLPFLVAFNFWEGGRLQVEVHASLDEVFKLQPLGLIALDLNKVMEQLHEPLNGLFE